MNHNWHDQEADVNDAHYRQPASALSTRLAGAQHHAVQQKHMLARELIHMIRTHDVTYRRDNMDDFYALVNRVVALLP